MPLPQDFRSNTTETEIPIPRADRTISTFDTSFVAAEINISAAGVVRQRITGMRILVIRLLVQRVLAVLRELRLPRQMERLADIVAAGETRRIHVGCATIENTGERRYFLLMERRSQLESLMSRFTVARNAQAEAENAICLRFCCVA